MEWQRALSSAEQQDREVPASPGLGLGQKGLGQKAFAISALIINLLSFLPCPQIGECIDKYHSNRAVESEFFKKSISIYQNSED